MKRLLVLLVLLAAGVVAAALAIPTNAASVNGSAISQQSLNSDVRAIAGSVEYQCYLNAEEYLSSQGTEQVPPVEGAGSAQNSTATSAFVATYLDTEISHRLVLQAASQRGVTVSPAQLAQARTALEAEISTTMTRAFETGSQTGDSALTCGASSPLTGQEVLATMPSSFVSQEVQFVATASALEEDVAGVGSSEADLERFFDAHRSEFDTVCLSAAAYTSESAAEAGAAAVAFGTPFIEVAASATQSASLGCGVLSSFASALGTTAATLDKLAIGQASVPLQTSGGWFIVSPSSRTPSSWDQARQAVAQAVQLKGASATQRILTAAERRSSVQVNPQYGIWVSEVATVLTPLTPQPTDVLNASANEPGSSTASAGTSGG